jgi:GT2 family glycosyltransferase
MLSFIICSIDNARFQAVSANIAGIMGAHPFEIIRIADATSLAEGYNRGLAASRGDHLVFCHDDIEILAWDFPARLLKHFESYDVLGVAGSTRLIGGGWIMAGPPFIFGQVAHVNRKDNSFDICLYGVTGRANGNNQAVDGLIIAAKRAVVVKLMFDAATFDHFHLYDLDFSFRAHLAGFKVAVVNDLLIIHASGGSFDQRWQIYKDRFEAKHRPHLQTTRQIAWQMSFVRVKTREEVAYVMDAPWFSDQNPER